MYLSTFHLHFVILLTFRFVVFFGVKRQHLLFCHHSVIFSRRKDDETKRQVKRRQIRSLISKLCLSSLRPNFVVLSTICFVILLFFRSEKTIVIILRIKKIIIKLPEFQCSTLLKRNKLYIKANHIFCILRKIKKKKKTMPLKY